MGSKHFRTVYDFARADADAVIRCLACHHEKGFTGMELVKLFGGPLPLERAMPRMKCQKCGHRGAQIAATPRL